MKTSRKLRMLQRRIKLRRQRTAFFMIMVVLVVMMAHAAFSKPADISKEYSIVSVTVEPGDTLWSIAREYKSEGEDLRDFVYEIAANNGVKDCNIVCGQTLFVPVVQK